MLPAPEREIGRFAASLSSMNPLFLSVAACSVAVMLSPAVLDALEDFEDIRQADKAMAAYERDPSGAITLEEYECEWGNNVK